MLQVTVMANTAGQMPMLAVAPQAHQKLNEDDCSEWSAEAKKNSSILCVVGAVVHLCVTASNFLYNISSGKDEGQGGVATQSVVILLFAVISCLPFYVSLRAWRRSGLALFLLGAVGGIARVIWVTSSADCVNATLEDYPYPVCVDFFVKQQIPYRLVLMTVVAPLLACQIFRLQTGHLAVLCAAQLAFLLVLNLLLPTLTSYEFYNLVTTCGTFSFVFAATILMTNERSTRAARQEKTIQELKARRKGDRIVNHNIKNASGTRALMRGCLSVKCMQLPTRCMPVWHRL